MRTPAPRHVRLLLSALTGVVVFLAAPVRDTVVSVLVGWNSFTVLFLALVLEWMSRQSPEQFRSAHEQEDETAPFVLLVATVAAFLSVVAIVGLLAFPPLIPASERAFRSGLAGLTVVSSWVLVAIMFTLHYANVYYRPDEDGPGGLAFPGDREPDYRDFLYYSFVIGCASQTGDVATVSRAMRHLTMVHGIVSFAFNTAILALTINVGASLLS